MYCMILLWYEFVTVDQSCRLTPALTLALTHALYGSTVYVYANAAYEYTVWARTIRQLKSKSARQIV